MTTKANLPKSLFTVSLILLLFMGCNPGTKEQDKQKEQDEQIEEKEEITTEPAQAVAELEFKNEALMDSLIANLSGIEYFFVKQNSNKQGLYSGLLKILESKKDPNYETLKDNRDISDKIRVLDTKNGYLVEELSSADWSGLAYYTYWNLTDGSGNKLLAKVMRGCGFVCEDFIYFYRLIKSNSEGSDYRFEDVEQKDIIMDYVELPKRLLGLEEIDDYYPISYNLPQKGKNILMCSCDDINLDHLDDDLLERKGNCIELMWNGDQGTFTPGEQAKK